MALLAVNVFSSSYVSDTFAFLFVTSIYRSAAADHHPVVLMDCGAPESWGGRTWADAAATDGK